MKECYAHTDLEWRLAQIPNHAANRGIFSNMLDDLAGNLSPETQRRYREFFQTYRFSAFKYYPIKDYLTRMVKLSEIHFGVENIYRASTNSKRTRTRTGGKHSWVPLHLPSWETTSIACFGWCVGRSQRRSTMHR